ncbi:MAG TPA: transposase [Thermoanaerobaculia bacterium]|nr:transposase [Thermoanaerobaculia bacterium]
MGRKLRYAPEGGALFEITDRTIQGRPLFRPSPELNEIVLGVLGRAQRLHEVSLCSFVMLSGHYHMLVRVKDARQLAKFMQYFNGNLAKEIARRTDWKATIFPRRYEAIPVSDEEAAQIERLKYHLSHGVKEDLVERVDQWPGVHCARALIEGKPLEGFWFNRSQEYGAKVRGQVFGKYEYAEKDVVVFDPLPCWSHLPVEEQRRRVAELVQEIEEEARIRREAAGIKPLGVKAILAQDPTSRPKKLKKSPAPFVHAATKAMRRELWEAYAWFVAAYRDAAEKLRAGDRDPPFPPGCFPPAMPFVGA